MAAALPASCGGEEVGGVQARQRMSVATDLAQAAVDASHHIADDVHTVMYTPLL